MNTYLCQNCGRKYQSDDICFCSIKCMDDYLDKKGRIPLIGAEISLNEESEICNLGIIEEEIKEKIKLIYNQKLQLYYSLIGNLFPLVIYKELIEMKIKYQKELEKESDPIAPNDYGYVDSRPNAY